MTTLEARLDQDLKTALLAGDARTVSTLRGLKSAILYAKVAGGSREQELAEDALQAVLRKEVKKRQESAELYEKGNRPDKAADERAEQAIIEGYLPPQLSEAAVVALADKIIAASGGKDQAVLGAVIGAVKQQAGSAGDGAMIARVVKERLQ